MDLQALTPLQQVVAWDAAAEGGVAVRWVRRAAPPIGAGGAVPGAAAAATCIAPGAAAAGGATARQPGESDAPGAGGAGFWGLHFPTPMHREAARRRAFEEVLEAGSGSGFRTVHHAIGDLGRFLSSAAEAMEPLLPQNHPAAAEGFRGSYLKHEFWKCVSACTFNYAEDIAWTRRNHFRFVFASSLLRSACATKIMQRSSKHATARMRIGSKQCAARPLIGVAWLQ